MARPSNYSGSHAIGEGTGPSSSSSISRIEAKAMHTNMTNIRPRFSSFVAVSFPGSSFLSDGSVWVAFRAFQVLGLYLLSTTAFSPTYFLIHLLFHILSRKSTLRVQTQSVSESHNASPQQRSLISKLEYAIHLARRASTMLLAHTYIPLYGIIVEKPVYCRYMKHFYNQRKILHYLVALTLLNLFILLSRTFAPHTSFAAAIIVYVGISGIIPSYKKRGYTSRHHRDLHAGIAYLSAATLYSGIPIYKCVAFGFVVYLGYLSIQTSRCWIPEARADAAKACKSTPTVSPEGKYGRRAQG